MKLRTYIKLPNLRFFREETLINIRNFNYLYKMQRGY